MASSIRVSNAIRLTRESAETIVGSPLFAATESSGRANNAIRPTKVRTVFNAVPTANS